MITEADQVVLCIYPDFDALSGEFEKQNELSKEAFVEMHLKNIWQEFQKVIEANEYRWHDRGMQWKLVHGLRSPFQSFLSASVCFGDAIEDEWFCVKLLLDFTEQRKDVVATIFDSDGDFMLIEAADVLPAWLEPETSENRIFISDGKVQIIMQNKCPSNPDLQTALKLVRAGGCEASQAIQSIISKRAAEPQFLHKTRLRLPERLIKLFNYNEALIGPALSAFYNRAPEDMRICTEMPHFNPGKTGGPLHLTTFALTRIQFAQLACQEFVAPANENVNFQMENVEDPIAAELGMKLTCGMEILLAKQEQVYLEFSPCTENVSIQQLVDVFDFSSELILNNEPAESLDWMRVDEVDLQEQLNATFSKLSMNPEEEQELLDAWTEEFDGTKEKVNDMKKQVSELDSVVEKMKSMLQSVSTFEGLDLEAQSEDEDSESSEDEDFIEREIFEAINFDPDLLMKIVEANAHMGADNTEFLAKFKEFQAKNENRAPSGKQKGLADIDPAKLEEARKSAREEKLAKINFEDSEGEAEQVESESELDEKEQDDLIYGKSKAQMRKELETQLQESNSESESDFEAYTEAMDAELKKALLSAGDLLNMSDEDLKINLAKGLLQSADASRGAGKSPIETILASLKERLPTPQ